MDVSALHLDVGLRMGASFQDSQMDCGLIAKLPLLLSASVLLVTKTLGLKYFLIRLPRSIIKDAEV